MDETIKAKLIFIRDEVFGPNSSIYECMTDDELVQDYNQWTESDWWQEHYKTQNGLIAWGRFQLEMEAEHWSSESIDAKDFLKDITKRWNLFKKLEQKYFGEGA